LIKMFKVPKVDHVHWPIEDDPMEDLYDEYMASLRTPSTVDGNPLPDFDKLKVSEDTAAMADSGNRDVAVKELHQHDAKFDKWQRHGRICRHKRLDKEWDRELDEQSLIWKMQRDEREYMETVEAEERERVEKLEGWIKGAFIYDFSTLLAQS